MNLPQELEILRFLLTQGSCSASDISQELVLSNLDTIQTLRNLIDDKLIKQHQLYYSISPKGIELINRKPVNHTPELLKSLTIQEDIVLKIIEHHTPIGLERIAKIIGTPKTKITKLLKVLVDYKLVHEEVLSGRRKMYHYMVQGLCPEVSTEYKLLMIQVFNRKYSPIEQTNKDFLNLVLDSD